MPWIRRVLRGNPVYVRVDEAGRPVAGPDGRVDVSYRAEPGGKLYRASVRNLEPTGHPEDEQPVALDLDAPPRAVEGVAPIDPIVIYTDGACSGNPGPMGIGVVILDRGERREISEYLGEGTNNIAELTAILRALESVPPPERRRPVLVHSDSAYALGLLGQNWKAKKNVELVAELRRLVTEFPTLRLVKVPGHSGVPENERCDQLANAAVSRGR